MLSNNHSFSLVMLLFLPKSVGIRVVEMAQHLGLPVSSLEDPSFVLSTHTAVLTLNAANNYENAYSFYMLRLRINKLSKLYNQRSSLVNCFYFSGILEFYKTYVSPCKMITTQENWRLVRERCKAC